MSQGLIEIEIFFWNAVEKKSTANRFYDNLLAGAFRLDKSQIACTCHTDFKFNLLARSDPDFLILE